MKMETESIKNVELFSDIELEIAIKYESFISNIKENQFIHAKKIFNEICSSEIDDKMDWIKEYYIKEVLDQLNSSQKAALWSIAYDEEEYDIRSIEGVFPVEWTDFIFENLYYDEVLVIEYLKKYINPYKISAHSKKDLYYVFGKLSRK